MAIVDLYIYLRWVKMLTKNIAEIFLAYLKATYHTNQVSFFKPKFIKTIGPTGAEFSNSKVYSNFAWISIAM